MGPMQEGSMPVTPFAALSVVALGLASFGCTPALAAIDANTATQAQLETVPGIGPAIAARILAARAAGPYRDVADLAARVRGIGEASARRMVGGGLMVAGARPGPPPAAEASPPPERIVGMPVVPVAAWKTPPAASTPTVPGIAARASPAPRCAKVRTDSR